MLKSCKYCSKIHDRNYICSSKPIRSNYKKTEEDKFRNTKVWQRKREEIKTRDKGLCRVCMHKIYNTNNQYNHTDIEVHHIEPLREAYNLRLEDSNLISLCKYHHELAERGDIPALTLKDIIKQGQLNQVDCTIMVI